MSSSWSSNAKNNTKSRQAYVRDKKSAPRPMPEYAYVESRFNKIEEAESAQNHALIKQKKLQVGSNTNLGMIIGILSNGRLLIVGRPGTTDPRWVELVK